MSRKECHFIVWNGESSRSKNLVMLSAPDMPTAVRRGLGDNTVEYLPGDYWTDYKSFDVVKKKLKFYLKDVGWDKYYDVRGWLQGSGKLTFSDYPNVEYDARVTNLEVAEQPGMKIITVNFVIQPIGMLMPPEPASNMSMTTKKLALQNLGNTWAYPLITLTGTGGATIKVKVGDTVVQTLVISGLAGGETIIMDSMPYVQEAYNAAKTVSKNHLMSGDFIILPTGHSEIEITASSGSTITGMTVEPRWCFV